MQLCIVLARCNGPNPIIPLIVFEAGKFWATFPDSDESCLLRMTINDGVKNIGYADYAETSDRAELFGVMVGLARSGYGELR